MSRGTLLILPSLIEFQILGRVVHWIFFVINFQIIWFTALFPYFVMFILLFRAITLPGAWEGMKYYVYIDYEKLYAGKGMPRGNHVLTTTWKARVDNHVAFL